MRSVLSRTDLPARFSEKDDLVRRLHQHATWAWVGDDGRHDVHRVKALPVVQRRAILAWLRARADELHRRQELELARTVRDEDANVHTVTLALAALGRTDPAEWLEQTPLVRRLVALQTRDAAPGPARLRPRRWWELWR